MGTGFPQLPVPMPSQTNDSGTSTGTCTVLVPRSNTWILAK